MKTKISILALTKAFFILLIMCCFSCKHEKTYYEKDGVKYEDYTDYTIAKVNKMKPPIILIAIDEKQWMGTGCTIKDANNEIFAMGNMSYFATSLANSRHIGDTIVK